MLARKLIMWSSINLLSLRATPIPGALNLGADLMSRGNPQYGDWTLHPQVVTQIWTRFGQPQVDLFASRENAQCPLYFSLRDQEAPLGVDALAHNWPHALLYAFPPLALISPTLTTVRERGLTIILIAPRWVFEEWYGKSHTLSFQCSMTTILSFLQELLDKGKAFSTIKVYLAAISACHVGFVDGPVSHHPLVRYFMKGAQQLHPVSKPLVPTWDLSLVLGAVSQPPFEPLSQVEIKILSLKTALLLALASAKHISDIHALSIHKQCTRFTRDNSRVILRPNLAFVPQNPYLQCTPLELEAFCPPPFSSPEQERLDAVCPVKALCTYTHFPLDC
ncbi:uncharacterized protein LOC112848041 [Oreochromis niloticus]|uniref:uncharacterized protein LOC112848041 n=1 Tax=Oreochromis niloticus TaxID=8128 RepID=UPI000DF17AED|nr:uncharacterized protein LOC112848041 [Oreochromis niloticus]